MKKKYYEGIWYVVERVNDHISSWVASFRLEGEADEYIKRMGIKADVGTRQVRVKKAKRQVGNERWRR